MYWMLSNLVTNSQDFLGWGERMGNSAYFSGPGNERRWLYLHYSIDCLNWFPAGCVARWPGSVHRSFMYPTAAIDGDDLVILSRTSRDASEQHCADLCTVHRVRNFRDLAMDLPHGRTARWHGQALPRVSAAVQTVQERRDRVGRRRPCVFSPAKRRANGMTRIVQLESALRGCGFRAHRLGPGRRPQPLVRRDVAEFLPGAVRPPDRHAVRLRSRP